MTRWLSRLEIIRQAFGFYRRYAGALSISASLLGLIGYASNEAVGMFSVSMATLILLLTAFHALFGGGSAFFNVILANVMTLYLCLFTFFVESLFQGIPHGFIVVGFLLPLAGFFSGVVQKREEIRDIIQSRVYIEEAKFIRSFFWLVPIALIGIAAFTLHEPHGIAKLPRAEQLELGNYLLAEMAAITVIAFLASRDFTLMLIDSGVLFGEFFADNVRLIKPAFAFFTFYSMNIIAFAGIYKMIERLSAAHHFMIHGELRDLTFIESLYFSLITISTVGYGDIVPVTNAIRLIIALQTFCGTMLFLFGVHAILSHKWESHGKPRHPAQP